MAFTHATDAAVEKKLTAGTITSSPGPMPRALSERIRPSVPDATLATGSPPRTRDSFFSNDRTRRPIKKSLERIMSQHARSIFASRNNVSILVIQIHNQKPQDCASHHASREQPTQP